MSAPTDSSSSNSRQKPVTAATSPGRTFKTWLNYSEGMATKQEVAGKYGGTTSFFCVRTDPNNVSRPPKHSHIVCNVIGPPCFSIVNKTVDMREPDPSTSNQRALKLLRAAYEIIPDTVNANGAQFDYVSLLSCFATKFSFSLFISVSFRLPECCLFLTGAHFRS